VRWTRFVSGLEGSSLAVDPFWRNTLYARTSSSSVFRRDDGGAGWTPINGGVPGGRVPAIAVDSSTPSTIHASAGCGGVHKSTDRD